MKSKPTESELEILQVLWEHKASTVRQVNELLNNKRADSKKKIGYTTTLKIMQLMNEKGLVIRDDSSRTHIYEANVSEKVAQNSLLERFLNTTFKGSAMKLVMQALGRSETTPEELKQIRSYLDELEDKKDA
ncbi:MAG: BlaI/MecI/CopY family transcriptional regulator [Chitinophagales bacterium]